MRQYLLLILFSSMYLQNHSFAQEIEKNIIKHRSISNMFQENFLPSSDVIHNNRDISLNETLVSLGIVQSVFLGGYIVGQYETIKEHGSFKNWYTNISKVHFDKDSYDYNIITHIGNAHYAFLFYRSRGFTKMNSFLLTTIGSTVFEFLIETVTEPPSVQDLWQTPVLGSLLGMGTESLSLYLLNMDFIVTDVLGYILNPFTILPFSYYEVNTIPIISKRYTGIGITFALK